MATSSLDSFQASTNYPHITKMSKDQASKCPVKSSCEKICKATFGTLHPRNNNVPNPSLSATDKPTAKARVSYAQPIALQQPTSGQEIPIESVPPEVKPVKRFVRFSSEKVKKNEDGGGKELAGQKTFSEEKYNSYIDRTKMKMRAPSDVGGGKTVSRRDSLNDRISNYLSRAKLKMRTTSNMGADGKAVPFKNKPVN